MKIKLKEIKAILADWCNETSAHGFQFLVSTTHTLWEKLIWATFITIVFYYTFYGTYYNFNLYVEFLVGFLTYLFLIFFKPSMNIF